MALRDDQELLDGEPVVRVGAAVEDIEERDRQTVGVEAAERPVEREAVVVGGGAGDRQRDREDRVRAQPGAVLRPVEFDEQFVERGLALGVLAHEFRGDPVFYGADRFPDALPPVALRVAVPALHRLVRPGGGAGGGRGPPEGAAVQPDLGLHRREAARVEDFAGADPGDQGRFVVRHRRGRILVPGGPPEPPDPPESHRERV